MAPDERDRIIRREFKRRGRRGTVQVLSDIREKLRGTSGHAPSLQTIVWHARQLGIAVRWEN